jgi:hypothetical protein
MAKKMTKAQAMDMLDKQVSKVGEAGMKRLEAGMPKLKASAKKMAEVLKKNDSPELIDTQAKHLKLQTRPVAEGVALLDEAIRRLKEAEKDEELFELVADDMAKIMEMATGELEKARKELRAAKLLTDQAEKQLSAKGSDSEQAGEEWASSLAEFERVATAAEREAPAWATYEAEAKKAVEARDKMRLERARKAKPAGEMLGAILDMPAGKPFAAFEKEFKVATLGKALQDEIAVDKAKAMLRYHKLVKLAQGRLAAEARVMMMAIEPRDGRKALGILGLPGAALAKLQAALDGPEAARAKALEALAKANKLDTTAKDMLAKLAKAGIL